MSFQFSTKLSDLPDLCLKPIFINLPLSFLLLAEMVCHHWFAIAREVMRSVGSVNVVDRDVMEVYVDHQESYGLHEWNRAFYWFNTIVKKRKPNIVDYIVNRFHKITKLELAFDDVASGRRDVLSLLDFHADRLVQLKLYFRHHSLALQQNKWPAIFEKLNQRLSHLSELTLETDHKIELLDQHLLSLNIAFSHQLTHLGLLCHVDSKTTAYQVVRVVGQQFVNLRSIDLSVLAYLRIDMLLEGLHPLKHLQRLRLVCDRLNFTTPSIVPHLNGEEANREEVWHLRPLESVRELELFCWSLAHCCVDDRDEETQLPKESTALGIIKDAFPRLEKLDFVTHEDKKEHCTACYKNSAEHEHELSELLQNRHYLSDIRTLTVLRYLNRDEDDYDDDYDYDRRVARHSVYTYEQDKADGPRRVTRQLNTIKY